MQLPHVGLERMFAIICDMAALAQPACQCHILTQCRAAPGLEEGALKGGGGISGWGWAEQGEDQAQKFGNHWTTVLATLCYGIHFCMLHHLLNTFSHETKVSLPIQPLRQRLLRFAIFIFSISFPSALGFSYALNRRIFRWLHLISKSLKYSDKSIQWWSTRKCHNLCLDPH